VSTGTKFLGVLWGFLNFIFNDQWGAISMRNKWHSCISFVGALALMSLAAGQAEARGPDTQLRILEVHSDAGQGTIEILGENFGANEDLSVSLGLLGDITDLCELSLDTPPDTIVCQFSPKKAEKDPGQKLPPQKKKQSSNFQRRAITC
jgi:hypothetical protein